MAKELVMRASSETIREQIYELACFLDRVYGFPFGGVRTQVTKTTYVGAYWC
jgi:hypothetical protein